MIYILLILLGVLQAVMQGTLFYNSFKFLDKIFAVKWFSKNTDNQNTWYIKILDKKYYVYKYFPFIAFVDLFHLCHSLFGIVLAYITYSFTNSLVIFILTGILYSVSFEFMLQIMKYIRNKYAK